MSSWPVNPRGAPEFVIDQEVWIIWGRERYRGTRVLTILFELCAEADYGQNCQLICTGYRLQAISDSPDGIFRPNQVYPTEAVARELSQWCPVDGLSAEKWRRAIGHPDDDEDALAGSELSPCCAKISHLRRLLFLCQKDGGLIERDRRRVEYLWDTHQDEARARDPGAGPLSQILSQLVRS